MANGPISRTVDSRGHVRWRVRFELPVEYGRRRQRQNTVATRREEEFLLAHVQTAYIALAGRATALSVDRWLRAQSSNR